MNTRRQFLIHAPLSFLVTAAACRAYAPGTPQSTTATPGAPPTFGAGPGVGPDVTAATFAEAEKLVQFTMTDAERQQAAATWRTSMAGYLERRTGPRKIPLAAADAPAALWNPMLPGIPRAVSRDRFVRSNNDGKALPASDEDSRSPR